MSAKVAGELDILRSFERNGSEFDFLIKLNGKKIAGILDTGSPISILPTSYPKTVKPKKVIG